MELDSGKVVVLEKDVDGLSVSSIPSMEETMHACGVLLTKSALTQEDVKVSVIVAFAIN